MKAANAEYRKENRAALKTMTAYQRSQTVPFPPYAVTNMTGNIARLRGRLAGLERQRDTGPVYRTIAARFAGACDRCGSAIERGDTIHFCRVADERVLCFTCG